MRRKVSHLLAVTAGACGVLAGCNLIFGIEEKGARPLPDEASADAGIDAAEAGRPTFEKCARDTDCLAPNACYTAKCDTVLGACTYALCEAKGRTCAIGNCDTKTFACSDPQPYGFVSTSYDVSGVTSGCGPNPRACVAAAFPFLFLGTRDDVVALRVDDFAGKTPVKVPILDLTARPQQIIASGRRVWVLGAVQGEAPPYQLPIASLDVPSDPTAKALQAHTIIVRYPFPTAIAFAAPNGGLYVSYGDSAKGFPTAKLDHPLTDGTSFVPIADAGAPRDPSMIAMYRAVGVAGGASVVAASGDRLVAYRAPLTFNLIVSPGTATASTQPDLVLNVPAGPIGTTSFAQGPDGAILMAASVVSNPAGDCNCNSRSRLQWVFANAVAITTDVNQFLDPELFQNPQVPLGLCNQCAAGYYASPVLPTWLDRRSALAASPFSGDRTVTEVRYLARDPFDGNIKRRAQTRDGGTPKGDFATDRIALTSANGIGYLVLADGEGNDVSVSIVDPRCDAK